MAEFHPLIQRQSAAGPSELANIRQECSDVLQSVLGGADRVAYLDHPAHFNAGDLLIYAGGMRLLALAGVAADYVCATHTYRKPVMDAAAPDCPLVLHGGGNFGDRWPVYQEFRERVIAGNHSRRIISLPQTMEFRSAEARERAQSVYSAHPDLTVLVRDRRGAREAQELFPHNTVRFCPDFAFGCAPIRAAHAPDVDIVTLKRSDNEAVFTAGDLPATLTDGCVCDWHISAAGQLQVVARRLRHPRAEQAADPPRPGRHAHTTGLRLAGGDGPDRRGRHPREE